MGRMLDTLKLGEGRRTAVQAKKPADEGPVQDCVVDWEIGAEVPFVEVGGPNKKVELSPGLMKHPAQEMPKPPHLTVDAPARAQVVHLTPAQPMAVAFEPWPGAAGSIAVSSEIVAYHHPDHAASKEYAKLLDAMLANVTSGTTHVLLLVGLKPHVGASTVLLNLGVIAAQARKLRVALVDANLAHPGLAQRLGCAAAVGLAEVTDGAVALEHAMIKTGIDTLHLLPAGTRPTTLSTEAMSWLIARLRERYDLVLIDGPIMTDTPAIAVQIPHANGIYLVLPQGENASIGKGFSQTISRMGGRLCGLVHTHFEM